MTVPRVLAGLVASAHRRAEQLAAGPLPTAPQRRAPSFREALAGRQRLSVIAEFKRRSPSAGAIRDDDPERRARVYREGGAAAISVLTEPDAFGGSLTDVTSAARGAGLPVLMKDFIVGPAQIRAGWSAGASAVLLIVRCLADEDLVHLHAEAKALGLDTLVETHDPAEIERALALPDAVVGINNRDLDTLTTDRRRALALLPRIPPDRIAVAESGYLTPDHLAEIRGRADAALIGAALMRAADPSEFLRAATRPPRAA